MNAEAIPPRDYDRPIRAIMTVNPKIGLIRHRGAMAKVSPDTASLIQILANVSPNLVPRERIMKAVFSGKRLQQNPAASLHQVLRRARTALRPLGVEIFHAPNPLGDDLPGFYSLGLVDRCPLPRVAS